MDKTIFISNLLTMRKMRVVTSLPMDQEFEVSEEFSDRRASRRAAVGLAGYAPCLVPSHGHPALIPDASGRLFVPGLRAALAQGNGVWWSGLAVPFNVPRCSRCQGLRARCALAS